MVKIMSHLEAIKELKIAPNQVSVICITDEGEKPNSEIVSNAVAILNLQFSDSDSFKETIKTPTKEDVKKAINFAEEHGDVWVCCHTGISRSAAIAYVIESMQVHPAMAVNIWNKNEHLPNRFIIRLGGEILKNPDLEKYYMKWINR